MGLKERLTEASETGEIITIVYRGGSQPGTKREISPIKVSKTKVQARCLATEEIRTFNLSKLEIVSEDYPAKNYDPKAESNHASVENLIAQQITNLPNIPAKPEQISHAESLGIKLSANPSRIEIVLSILLLLIEQHHIAQVVYFTDVEGRPWVPLIEPYTFQRSKEGIRLRCWVYETEPAHFLSFDYMTDGWHLYQIKDIESVRDTGKTFTPREYKSRQDDITISLCVNAEGIVTMDLKK